MTAVATFYHLPPQALPAIHVVENGRAGIVRHNHNGTDDLGAMQINTLWLPALAHGTGMSTGQLRRALIHENCFNIAVAGAILRIYLHEAGGDLIKAIGLYHSHTPMLAERFQQRVLSTFRLGLCDRIPLRAPPTFGLPERLRPDSAIARSNTVATILIS